MARGRSVDDQRREEVRIEGGYVGIGVHEERKQRDQSAVKFALIEIHLEVSMMAQQGKR